MPHGLLLPAILLALAMLGSLLALRLGARNERLGRQISTFAQPASPTLEAPMQRLRRKPPASGRSGTLLHHLLNHDPAGPRVWPMPRILALGGLVGLAAAAVSHLVLPLWLAVPVGLAAALACLRGLFGFLRRRYANSLVRQLPDTIQLIVSAVRAGMPATEAFGIVAQSMPDPTREQFRQVVDDIRLGRPAEDALLDIFERTRLAEYAIFSVTLSVQSKAGGRLAETLQIMADTIRERINLAGRAKALAGEAALSARVLSALPFVAGGILSLERPGYLDIFLVERRGRILLVVGLSFLAAGTLMMRHMIRKGTTV